MRRLTGHWALAGANPGTPACGHLVPRGHPSHSSSEHPERFLSGGLSTTGMTHFVVLFNGFARRKEALPWRPWGRTEDTSPPCQAGTQLGLLGFRLGSLEAAAEAGLTCTNFIPEAPGGPVREQGSRTRTGGTTGRASCGQSPSLTRGSGCKSGLRFRTPKPRPGCRPPPGKGNSLLHRWGQLPEDSGRASSAS